MPWPPEKSRSEYLRKQAEGLCVCAGCENAAVSMTYCDKHLAENRERMRKAQRNIIVVSFPPSWRPFIEMAAASEGETEKAWCSRVVLEAVKRGGSAATGLSNT